MRTLPLPFLLLLAALVGCGSASSLPVGGGLGGTDGRGACNTDSDCVFKSTDQCCGSCLAAGDTPKASTSVCNGACVIPPGGCSCVNHVCARGILTQGTSCELQQDACGDGLRCCRVCPGVAPADGGTGCAEPACTPAAMTTTIGWSCPRTL